LDLIFEKLIYAEGKFCGTLKIEQFGFKPGIFGTIEFILGWIGLNNFKFNFVITKNQITYNYYYSTNVIIDNSRKQFL
jgi:hypothetical protein